MQSVGTSNKGSVRTENQDYIFFSDEPVGTLENLYIVADGMGGHQAGGYASSFAVDRFVELVKLDVKRDPVEIFQGVIQKISQELAEESQKPEYSNMGTTFVAATVTRDGIYIMNIGDSRLYLIDDDIRQITVDHSYVEELIQAGELDRSNSKNHPNKNLITRALGAGMKDVEPDFFKINQKQGYLLLCTDGLYNMVDDDEIKEIILDHSQLSHKATQLEHRAIEYGGRDNIALVIVELER